MEKKYENLWEILEEKAKQGDVEKVIEITTTPALRTIKKAEIFKFTSSEIYDEFLKELDEAFLKKSE